MIGEKFSILLIKGATVTEVEVAGPYQENLASVLERAKVEFDPQKELCIGIFGHVEGIIRLLGPGSIMFEHYRLYILPKSVTLTERRVVKLHEGSTGGASEDEPEVKE